jgi:hypothetical protein
MKIPSKDDFTNTLKVLPWDYSEKNRYLGANILWNILNLSIFAWFYSDGITAISHGSGYIWSSSEYSSLDAWVFWFASISGGVQLHDRRPFLAVRPVFK